jgi:hypothetical protein
MQEEKYIGGIKSSHFKKKKTWGVGGYAIYVTSKRIIGIKGTFIGLIKDTAKGTFLDNVLFPYLSAGSMLGKKEKSKAVEQLEKNKDIEIFKKDVSGIEIKKPSALGFSAGHLKIERKNGEPVQISIPFKPDFKEIKKLMEAFKPESLKIV